MLEETGYEDELKGQRTLEAEGRLENLEEFVGVAAEYDRRAGEPSLDGFLQEISLYADADAFVDTSELITLMTLHNAKGLEFPVVFIAGMEEGVFPHQRSLDEQNLEEERRLAYVGMTRAMDRLYLLHARARTLWGSGQYNLPSRFLDEIPERLVERQTIGGRPALGRGRGGGGGFGGGRCGDRGVSRAGRRGRAPGGRRSTGTSSPRPTRTTPPSAAGAATPAGKSRTSTKRSSSSLRRRGTASFTRRSARARCWPSSRAASSSCASRTTVPSGASWRASRRCAGCAAQQAGRARRSPARRSERGPQREGDEPPPRVDRGALERDVCRGPATRRPHRPCLPRCFRTVTSAVSSNELRGNSSVAVLEGHEDPGGRHGRQVRERLLRAQRVEQRAHHVARSPRSTAAMKRSTVMRASGGTDSGRRRWGARTARPWTSAAPSRRPRARQVTDCARPATRIRRPPSRPRNLPRAAG